MTSRRLAVDGVTLERGGRRVLTDISFELGPGEIVTVVGPNGAGKTSLLDAVLGFLPLAAGGVRFDGRAMRSLRARAAVFSYMPDEAEPPAEVRVETLIAFTKRFGRAAPSLALELAQQLGLDALATERVGSLSRGQKRRVSLFVALCTNRPVVVLDEPLGAFDPLQLLEVLAVLRARASASTAVLMSAHQMSDAEKIASRILVLDAGRAIAFGTLADLRALAGRPGATLEDVFLALLRARRCDAGA